MGSWTVSVKSRGNKLALGTNAESRVPNCAKHTQIHAIIRTMPIDTY